MASEFYRNSVVDRQIEHCVVEGGEHQTVTMTCHILGHVRVGGVPGPTCTRVTHNFNTQFNSS